MIRARQTYYYPARGCDTRQRQCSSQSGATGRCRWRNGQTAERWFNEIVIAIRSLCEMPTRCPLADESDDLRSEVRLLLHGKRNRRYKIYFAIHYASTKVRVFHIRHWARKPVEKSELEELEKRKPGR